MTEEIVLNNLREEEFAELTIETDVSPQDVYAEIPVYSLDDVFPFDEELDDVDAYLRDV